MLHEINHSKEVIKNRMLKHALTYWGIKNTEDLDPAVKLIMEALSSELYNLGNEIKDTQVRILEKIANLLSPDFLTSPNPAHAILHAAPVEPTETLYPTTSFFAQRKISSKQNEELDTTIDLFFTPVDAVQLVDAQISYLVTGGNLYSYDLSFNKQFTARSKVKTAENNTLWLGLKTNLRLDNLQNLVFCFDWKNLEPKLANRIYQLLPLTKWFLDDREIEIKQGLQYPDNAGRIDSYEKIFLEYDLLSLREKDVKAIYDHKFITIGDIQAGKPGLLKQEYPASFKNFFNEADLQKLNEKLVWIKIVFPAAMQQEYLNEVYIYPNAFPVMNRRVNDLKYRLKGGSNIIPLKTATLDQFLSVKSLSDDVHRYKSVPYRKMEEEESGTYTLRNGGVERFDGRNARELIGYLLELLRSESAVFSAYGYDFIATTLKEMNQKIFLMEQKTRGYINNAAEIPNYIIVKPFEGHDMMYAKYWTTLAEVANNLRAGTSLQQEKGVKVKQDTIVLMTTTTGGKNRLRPEEKLNAFRYGIMTRNRIITKEDIRTFCLFELGDRITKVEVEKGFEMSLHSSQAFRRTIDVILTPSETQTIERDAWRTLCDQLKAKLQTRSGMSNYYRIVLKNMDA
jgi:hypothetical protein